MPVSQPRISHVLPDNELGVLPISMIMACQVLLAVWLVLAI